MFKNIIILIILGYSLFLNFGHCDQYKHEPNRCQFGINALKTFHIPDELYTTVSTRMGYMQELGVKWDRSDFWWHKIEQKQGIFDFTFPDTAIQFYEQNGIQMFPILCYHSNWANNGAAPATIEEQELFARYVEHCVRRYKNQITYWELWNEPNILPFWKPNPNVADYTALLKKSYIAAKKANPNCQIVGVCMAGYDPEFLERLYQLGGKDYFDVLSYHYYRTIPPEYEVPKELDDIHNLMARYNDGNKRIWITELGVSNHPKFGVPDDLHAAYLVRNHLLCFGSGYVDRIFQFDMINWTDDINATWDGMLGLMKTSGQRKPAYYAYQTMVNLLDGARIIGRVPFEGKDDIYAYVFEKDKQLIFVFWTMKGEKKFRINNNNRQITLINLFGEKSIIQNQSNELELTATEFPQYLLNAPSELILPASFKITPHSLELAPGEETETVLEVRNPFPRTITGKLLWTTSPGIIVTPQVSNVIIPANTVYQQRVKIKTNKNISENEYQIAYQFESESMFSKTVTTIKIHPEFNINVRPLYDREKKQWKIIVRITNQLKKPVVNATIYFSLENEKTIKSLGQVRIKNLKPGQQAETVFMVNAATLFTITKPFHLKVQFIPNEVWRKKTVVFPFAIHPIVEQPIQIDGILTEWEHIPCIELTQMQQVVRGNKTWSSNTLNGIVKLAWSSSDVYLAAEVVDIDPGYNPFPAGDLWRGDAVELYLGFAGPEDQRYYSGSDYQIGLSTGTETTQPFIFLWKKNIKIESGNIAICRLPNKYFLEARIPISELNGFTPKPNSVIGFDVAIDDLNRNESIDYARPPEGRSMMWHGTNMNWQNPSNWGIAIIK
ncbi:MAG: hypothetical protein N3A72_07080 [bacterium]|nr:hypothetical protein [bacterium]